MGQARGFNNRNRRGNQSRETGGNLQLFIPLCFPEIDWEIGIFKTDLDKLFERVCNTNHFFRIRHFVVDALMVDEKNSTWLRNGIKPDSISIGATSNKNETLIAG